MPAHWYFLSLTPTDPKVTRDNILRATRDSPPLDSQESYLYLDLPQTMHDEIKQKYRDKQVTRELALIWLNHHPCPNWDHLELVLSIKRKEKALLLENSPFTCELHTYTKR